MKDQTPPNPKEAAKGCALIIGLVLVIWFALPDCSGEPETEPKQKKIATDYKAECIQAAKAIVKQNLSSPSTADFPFGTSGGPVMKVDDSTYFISGYVDAQNGFGAVVRANYSLTVFYYPSIYSYTYDGLEIE